MHLRYVLCNFDRRFRVKKYFCAPIIFQVLFCLSFTYMNLLNTSIHQTSLWETRKKDLGFIICHSSKSVWKRSLTWYSSKILKEGYLQGGNILQPCLWEQKGVLTQYACATVWAKVALYLPFLFFFFNFLKIILFIYLKE